MGEATKIDVVDTARRCAMTAPITGAEIVALPGWRWCTGLAVYSPSEEDVCGVCRVEDGRLLMLTNSGAEFMPEDAEPDPSDPLLPGWLLHLLREREDVTSYTERGIAGGLGAWSVWRHCCGAWDCLGEGPTELHALVDALRSVA